MRGWVVVVEESSSGRQEVRWPIFVGAVWVGLVSVGGKLVWVVVDWGCDGWE